MVVAIILDASAGATLASSKDLIAPLVASTGVLIAVLAYSRDRGKIERDRAEARSKIFLEQAKQSLQDAFELLKDLNQDRGTWVHAARLILAAKKLGEEIPSAEYRRVYELAADQVRHQFHGVFMLTDGQAGKRTALPAAFFFGRPDWKTTELGLDQMAVEASPDTEVITSTPERPIPESNDKSLSPNSVIAVFEFLRFPANYIDPFDGIDGEAWSSWSDVVGVSQGARRYVEHRSNHRLVGKTLSDRTAGKGVAVKALE